MTTAVVQEQIVRLLDPAEQVRDRSGGYLDLLGPSRHPREATSPAQRMMRSTMLPRVYERYWRPVAFGFAKGRPLGPDTAEEYDLARGWLGLGHPGEPAQPSVTVLDVACGPGNVTRALAEGVGEDGLVVGLDTAPAMLARAVADTSARHVGFVRANALHLPFVDDAFDAVCCYGALYMFEDPWTALDDMARVLRPGGRIAVFATRRPGLPLSRPVAEIAGQLTGLRMFGDHELTAALADRGFDEITQRCYTLMQFVTGRLNVRAPK